MHDIIQVTSEDDYEVLPELTLDVLRSVEDVRRVSRLLGKQLPASFDEMASRIQRVQKLGHPVFRDRPYHLSFADAPVTKCTLKFQHITRELSFTEEGGHRYRLHNLPEGIAHSLVWKLENGVMLVTARFRKNASSNSWSRDLVAIDGYG
jgi:hypothetical protein